MESREKKERRDKRRLERYLERKLDKTMGERPCGGCTACCTVMGVEELNKPNHVECQHVSAGGCSIYETRPESCKAFQCMWRIGIGTMEQRPDLIGLVMDTTRPGDFLHPGFLVRELWPGAFEEAHELIQDVASRVVVIWVYGDKARRVLGPEDRLAPIAHQIREALGADESEDEPSERSADELPL